jgi:hypothetical protein
MVLDASPKVRLVLALAGQDLAPTDWAARGAELVLSNEFGEPQCLCVVSEDLTASTTLHYLLRVGVGQRVKRPRPQDFVVDEDELFVHVSLVDNNHTPVSQDAF